VQYLGGKFRLKAEISNFIADIHANSDYGTYVEPFAGGLWVFSEVSQKIKAKKIAYDICYPLINLYQNIQDGLEIPDIIDEDYYNSLNGSRDENDPLLAFVGFGCSFSGKYFGGYARSSDRNYAKNAKNSLLKKFKFLDGVEFKCENYLNLRPENSLIYCDPPYFGTTQYDYCKDFDHELFWGIMEQWKKQGNKVIVSEYMCMSSKFECVLEMPTKTDMHTNTGKSNRVECLFM
jgi:DNA adenine methylase